MYTFLSLLLVHLTILHHHVPIISAMQCDSLFKQSSGRINALSSSNVSSLTRCKYTIRTDVQRYRSWIKLTWDSFSVRGGKMPHCEDSSVVVYTGCQSQRKVATFCSNNLRSKPHDIYSPDNCITIQFNNMNRQSRGFVASWRSYSHDTQASFPGISCSFWTQKITTRAGVVGSPGWPSKYRDKTCRWTFRTGDTGLRYVYNIMDMDMYKDRNRDCDSSFSDNVYIKGEKSLTTKRKWKWYYCKYTSVDTNEFNTQYYEIDVSMNVRRDRSNQRGFVIGFVAYEDEVARALSSWGSLVGGLIVAFIAVIFVFCCYRRYRRRQLTESRPLVVATPQQPAGVPVVALPPPGSYPQQPAGYPQQPVGGYPQPLHAPGGYGLPPAGYPPPPVYTDKPPEYQPPPYEPPQGGAPYPPPSGGYPAAAAQPYPPPPQGGYPAQYPPP